MNEGKAEAEADCRFALNATPGWITSDMFHGIDNVF
jgi:hypothetical protein